MAVTDLTGTSWKLKDTLYTYSSSANNATYNVHISIEGDSLVAYMTLFIGWDKGSFCNAVIVGTEDNPELKMIAWGTAEYSNVLPDPWNTYTTSTITFTGGSDVTDSNLIAWLMENATDVTPLPVDVDIIYNGSRIAEMIESGTKTLKTKGTYCTDDISVVYTKPSSGGVQTTLVSGIYATDILYYTDENMAARSGYEIIDLYLPVGTLIFVYNTGPTTSDPVGVTKLQEYTPMKGQYILYVVGETHNGGSND